MRQTTIRARRGGWRLARAVRLGAVVFAVLGALAGTAVWLRYQQERADAPARTAVLGGLTATAVGADWVPMQAHDQDGQGGYQMPAQMMPGAPEGDDVRLGVKVTLTNQSGRERRFDLASEFFLGGGRTGQVRTLHSDTFGGLPRLAPASQVSGLLYFDTEAPGPADPPLYLSWRREHGEQRLAVELTGPAPEPHHHG